MFAEISIWAHILGLIILYFAYTFFSAQPYVVFSQSVAPILSSMQQTIALFIANLKNPLVNLNSISSSTLLNAWQDYPEWVYDVGFNPYLRAGYRFFLIQLERSMQLIILIEASCRDQTIALDLELKENIIMIMTNNIKLITELSACLIDKMRPQIAVDQLNDLASLDEMMQKKMPASLEALSLRDDLIKLTLLVRDIKDLRSSLLQLAQAFTYQDVIRKQSDLSNI